MLPGGPGTGVPTGAGAGIVTGFAPGLDRIDLGGRTADKAVPMAGDPAEAGALIL